MGDSPEIGELYDGMTDLMTRTHGGYQHGGYWAGPETARSAAEAGDRLTDRVGRALEPARGGVLLDVGCGSGKAALRLARSLDVAVTGITLSRYEAHLAELACADDPPPRSVRFEVADLRKMPFPAGSFDAAVAIESLCHLRDRTEGLAEVARVLRPGGLLALTDFVLRRPITDPARRAVVATAEQSWSQGPMLPRADYEAAVRRAGLEVLEFDDIGEAVRPSWDVVADEMLRISSPIRGFDDVEAFGAMAGQLRAFGAVTEVGYAVAVVRRPREEKPVRKQA
jgi:cyclopropane fatty-acyl-phospholipid synthase-like methyltransferase